MKRGEGGSRDILDGHCDEEKLREKSGRWDWLEEFWMWEITTYGPVPSPTWVGDEQQIQQQLCVVGGKRSGGTLSKEDNSQQQPLLKRRRYLGCIIMGDRYLIRHDIARVTMGVAHLSIPRYLLTEVLYCSI